MVAVYRDDESMRSARARYFEDNQFGADGGYHDPWVHVKLGPLPLRLPNTKARVRAVRYHDLHHVLTGYSTDIIGEFEISAWEIGAGCRDFYAAWVLNLGGMAGGLISAPRRTFRAFREGLASRSLYGQPLAALLDQTVGQVRAQTRSERPQEPTAVSFIRFVAACGVGVALGLLYVGLGVVLGPLWVLGSVRQRALDA